MPQGTFGWFAAWKCVSCLYLLARMTSNPPVLTRIFSIFGFFAALLFVPETKALSLEELDQGTSSPRLSLSARKS